MKRREARRLGLSRFSTGKPCRAGHFSERDTSSGRCIECAAARIHSPAYRAKQRARYYADLEANRARAREAVKRWRAENLDKDRARERERAHRRYHQLRPEAETLEQRRYRLARERRRRADEKARRKSERDARSQASAERGREQSKAWRLANPERYRALHRAWRIRNRDKRRQDKRAREIRKRHEVVTALMVAQRGRCGYCRVRLGPSLHIDHIMPRALGGGNERKNLQLLCDGCNLSKGAKPPEQFARGLGKLI